MHGGKQRPFRAFARFARVRGGAAQFSASPRALRATQKRPYLPGRTSGTVSETRRQRHCARGAAAGGMLKACPLIRGRALPTLAEGQSEAAWVAGAQPLVPFFGSFLGQARKELAVGRLPTSPSAHWAEYLKPPRGGTRQLRRSMSGMPKGRRRSTTDNLRRSPSGTYFLLHWTPCGMSLSRMPMAVSWSRMASARAKSFALRAACRSAIRASTSASRSSAPRS